MNRLRWLWTWATVLTIICGSAWAQETPDKDAQVKAQQEAAPAGKPADQQAQPQPQDKADQDQQAQPLTVTVKSVAGTAHRLLPGDEPEWAPLEAGEKLDETSIIRTGLRSKVVLAFADNSTVTVNRATKMGIAEFRKRGEVTQTKLGLKYGSLRATVEKAKGPNDFTVATPVGTMAVTGSGLGAGFTGDLGLRSNCSQGGLQVTQGFRTRNLSPGQTTNNQMAPAIALVQQNFTTMLGDSFGGTTLTEKAGLVNLSAGRGIIGFVGGGGGTQSAITPPQLPALTLSPEIIEPAPPPPPPPEPNGEERY